MYPLVVCVWILSFFFVCVYPLVVCVCARARVCMYVCVCVRMCVCISPSLSLHHRLEILWKCTFCLTLDPGRTLCSPHLSPQDSGLLTGYQKNGVCPVGMRKPLPIILSADIAALPFFYVGGGHVRA